MKKTDHRYKKIYKFIIKLRRLKTNKNNLRSGYYW